MSGAREQCFGQVFSIELAVNYGFGCCALVCFERRLDKNGRWGLF